MSFQDSEFTIILLKLSDLYFVHFQKEKRETVIKEAPVVFEKMKLVGFAFVRVKNVKFVITVYCFFYFLQKKDDFQQSRNTPKKQSQSVNDLLGLGKVYLSIT